MVFLDYIEDEIKMITGVKVSLVYDIAKTRNGEAFITLSSQNLKNEAGVMSIVYSELFISEFGGGITKDGNMYWLPLNFRWVYKDGGKNGTNLFNCFWDFEKRKLIVK